MIGMEAALAVVEGRTNEWPALIGDEMRLIETLNGDVSLIGQLTRNACLTIAHNIARWALEHGAPSPEHCRELQEEFRRAGETNLYPQALITERAMTLPVFKASISDLDRMGDQQGVTEKELNQNGFTIYQITGRADRDKIFYLDFMERAIETAQLGPPRMLALVDDFEVTINTAKENRYIVPGMFLPALGKTTVRFVTVQAAMRMTATAFALERFYQARGKMPEKLSELVPEFMDAVAIDPFDGDELRYAALGARGYLLYSVGEDGFDDGGREAPKRKKSTDTNNYDVVFKVER